MSGSGGASGGGGGTPQVDILALGVDTGPLKQAEGEVAKSLSRVEGAAEGAAQAFDVFEKSVQDAANAARQGAQATKTLEASTEGAGQAAREAGAAQAGLTQKTTEGATASRTQTAALKALEAELAEARRMMIAMGGTIADMNKAMEALQKQAAGAGKGLGGTAGAAAAAAGAYGLTTREIQQLLPQINDVFTQLSMGQGLLMVATAQGPQIIQQLGGFGNTLSALGRFMGSFIQSATGMSVALAAIGVAAIAMSESTNRSLSTLSQRLRMTRDDYAALSVAVTETAKRVAASSSMGGGDARDAGRIIASQSRFSGNEAELESLIRLSGRLARAMGTEVPAAAEVLARAIDKPADAARRLASEGLRTMDEALVRNVIRLENQGKTLEAQQAVIGAYRRALDEAAKTPLQQSLETLGNAFQRLGQALRPVVDAIGSVLARVLAVAVDWTAKLVDGLARLIELLSDNKLTQFFGMTSAPREPVVVAPQDRQQTEAAVRSVREINPRMLQRQALQDRITGLRSGLSAANGEERGLINAGVGALQEQLRGLQGPMDQYLKGLNQQVVVAQAWDGANRAVAEALIAVENAGGGAAAQAVALGLVRQRLRQEFANENATLNRNTVATLAQAEAQAGGARAAEESRIAAQAYLETLSKYQASDERFEQALQTRIGLLLEERDARAALRDTQNITSQEQQLELLRAEIDLVGTSVVQRERELAVLRERQRIMNEGGDPENDRGRQRLANAAQIAEATQALQRQQSAFTELSRIGEQAFDRIGEAITRAFATGNMKAINFRNIAKAVFSEVLQWMLRLAVINPLKNAFMGGNNPSIMDVASVAGLSGGGGGLSLGAVFGGGAQAAQAGAQGGMSGASSQAGQAMALRQAGQFGNLGAAFTNRGPAMTGFGWLDGALNTTVWGGPTAGINAGGAATNAAGYGSMAANSIDAAGSATAAGVGTPSLSAAGAIGGVAGIAGGAYGIYSGVQKGGVGGAVGAVGGLASMVGGASILGLLGPAMAALGPIGLGVGAVLAIAGSLMPGAKPSGMGQLARTNLNTGLETTEGLGGKRFSQANATAAGSTVDGIVRLAREVGDKLGGARIGGDVAVGVTNGTLYLDVHGQKAQFANDEGGAKQLAETAARMVLQEFRTQGTVQGPYRGIVAASGDSLERLDANLQWYEQTYKALIGTAEKTTEFAQSLASLAKGYDDVADRARGLGLAVGVIEGKRAEALEKALAPMLGTVQVADAYAEGVKQIEENYKAVIKVMGDLGRGTDDLSDAMGKAVAKFRTEIQRGFDSAVRGARGEGFIDQILAVRDNFTTNAQTYLSAGRDPNALYAAQISAIINNLDVKQLTTAIEALRGVDDVAVLFAETAITQKEVAENLAKAADVLQSTLSAGGSIRAYLNNLQANSGPGGVSSADAFRAAQTQFGTDLTLARGGDQDALSRITGTADRLLGAAQEQYASGVDFQVVRSFVLASLETLPATRSYDAQMLDALLSIKDGQVVVIDKLGLFAADTNNDGGISSAEFLTWGDGNTAALAALRQAVQAGDANALAVFRKIDANGDGALSRLEIQNSIASGIIGNTSLTAARVDQGNTLTGQTNDLLSAINRLTLDFNAQMVAVNTNVALGNRYASATAANTSHIANIEWGRIGGSGNIGVPISGSFAEGGIVTNGRYGQDSVYAKLAGGEMIVPANDVAANLAAVRSVNMGGGNEVVAELRAMRRELAALRAERAADARRIIQASERTADAAEDTAGTNANMARRDTIVGRRVRAA